jgi:hypothetical protein
MTTCTRCHFYDATDGRVCRACRAARVVLPAARASTLPPKVEADIQREVVAWLELHGWDVSITAVRQRPRGVTVGTPDLYVRRGRERVWVEVKRPSEGPSEAQLRWHAAERAAGGTVIVAYSIDDVAHLTTTSEAV